MYSGPRPISIRKPLRDRPGPNFLNHRSNFIWSRTLQHPVGTKDANTRLGNMSRTLQHPVGTTDVNKRLGNVLERKPASAVEEETEQQTPSLVATEGKLTEGAAPASEVKKPILLNIETFLAKLGLSKYLFSFKAEEIDLYALKHMDEDDLKAVGLPMGPRKKILYTIARLKAKK